MKQVLHKKLHEYRAVILDMDGTLYYQIPLRICMFFELLCYYGAHIKNLSSLCTLREYRKAYERGRLGERNRLIDFWMQEKPIPYIRLFRDKKLLVFMQALKHKGTKIVLYSDYPLEQKIKALSPFHADYYFCASDEPIQCLKPDTQGIRHIIAILHIPVENMVFIGDRYDKDGKCAEAVGMDYIILDSIPLLRSRLYKKEFVL
ncbi:MAG: HAD family hydrolase [Treponema sp.]|nr:HAD family hydrolase [Treponema sp.]